ncbi:hypothetical protein BH10ACT1_BH10ACT1_26410 [soil metagenome]
MRNDRTRTRRRSVAGVLLALVLATGLAACSSSDSGGSKAADTATALRRQNRAYLLSISWEREQADCVSRQTHVDLEALLSGSDASDVPTEKPDYEDFASAVRSCIRKDTALSTTTVPPG